MKCAFAWKMTTFFFFLVSGVLLCQQASTPSGSLPPNFASKFAFGKTAFIKNDHGSNIAYDAISSDIQGWGRFTLLNSPEKADFIVEISSYEGGSVSMGSHTDYATPDGKPHESSSATKNLGASTVTMKVYDPKTERQLWVGSEKVKSAFKKKAEEDNIVAAAEKLFVRFHDSVEPPGK